MSKLQEAANLGTEEEILEFGFEDDLPALLNNNVRGFEVDVVDAGLPVVIRTAGGAG